MIELQANRIWRSKLDVAYWRSHLIAYHVLRIMRVRKILAMIVIVADYLKRVEDSALVRLMLSTCFCGLCHLIKSESMSLAYCAFAYHEVWLRKQSTGYEVSLHQTTVVVQVGILTSVTVKMKAAS
ncbi:UDP-glucose:glycoprotein glucosyltransferase [Trichinella pseudospiralis]